MLLRFLHFLSLLATSKGTSLDTRLDLCKFTLDFVDFLTHTRFP